MNIDKVSIYRRIILEDIDKLSIYQQGITENDKKHFCDTLLVSYLNCLLFMS